MIEVDLGQLSLTLDEKFLQNHELSLLGLRVSTAHNNFEALMIGINVEQVDLGAAKNPRRTNREPEGSARKAALDSEE